MREESEREALQTALRDEADFQSLVRKHEAELRRFAYQMTGSLADADDILQETFVRAWRSLADFGGHGTLRGWLYRIAANTSIDLARRRRRQLPGGKIPWDACDELPTPEPTAWISPWPDDPEARASDRQEMSLAFIALMQQLSARARAVYVLRDLAGASAEETAEWLSMSTTAVNSSLLRSRAAVGPPQGSSHPSPEQRAIAERFAAVWETGDLGALLALLRDDVVLAMPPYAAWYRGPEAVCTFIERHLFSDPSHRRAMALTASGAPAAAMYRQRGATFAPFALAVLEISPPESRPSIARIDAFVDESLFRAFGLPSPLG